VELFLPAVPVSQAAETCDQQESGNVPEGGGRHILVVEDNDSVRRLTCRRLSELGYGVAEAANAVAALEILAEDGNFDLVFSDVVMPGGLSGLDLAREVARHFPNVRSLLTTGYAEVMLHSADGHELLPGLLRKPYSQADLARAIADALRGEPDDRPHGT
jgi:CheY-like chemotaxis protein